MKNLIFFLLKNEDYNFINYQDEKPSSTKIEILFTLIDDSGFKLKIQHKNSELSFIIYHSTFN